MRPWYRKLQVWPAILYGIASVLHFAVTRDLWTFVDVVAALSAGYLAGSVHPPPKV